ncbi:MAG: hypothetical protein ABL967_07050 [Bryobacteraceae bacterium]
MNKFRRLEDLRSLYRSTFQEWATQVGLLDKLRASAPGAHGLSDAQRRAEQADAEHRDVRNRLVEAMAGGTHNEERRKGALHV